MGTSYYNTWINDPFIYKSTISGVNVYSLGGGSLSLLGFIGYENTSSVWADDNYVYIATSVSGIYRCDVSTVTGTVTLTPYKQYPEITSNYVYGIHGGGNYLCATTEFGVDHYDLTTGSGIHTTLSGVNKCFQTEPGEFYYSYNKFEGDKEVHVVYDNTNNWDIETVGSIYTIDTYDAACAGVVEGWLGTWAKRIKLTIDNTNVDNTLSDFPVLLKLSDSSGISSIDVTSVFTDLHPNITVTLLSDTCSGIFTETWVDKSNDDSYAGYSAGKLSLDLNHGGATEGVNALSKDSFSCLGTYTFEFDWYPVDGGDWYDDDYTDGKNMIDMVPESPLYHTGDWYYNECEYMTGTNSKLMLHLRSSKSNKITVRQRLNGARTYIIDEAFTYGSSHHVKWVIGFDHCWTELYMDGNQIGSRASWDESLLGYIGEKFKLNFHWHSYAHTANQRYDNLLLTCGETSYDSRKKIALTTSNGVTQCNVEIERWDVGNNEAWLWVGVHSVNTGVPTVLYFYYDSDQSDNTDYIGDTGDTPAQNVWDSNFKLVMHMAQNPSGDVADSIKDSTSNANHGTPDGSMTTADLVDGKIGKGIDFDGGDDYLSCSNISAFNDTNVTVEAVLNNNNSTPFTLCHHGDNNSFGNQGWAIRIFNNVSGGILFGYFSGDWRSVYSDSQVPNAQVNIAVTYDEIALEVAPYINGVADPIENLVATTVATNSTFKIVAIKQASMTEFFDDVLSEFRVSDTARSADWIKATYYSNWDTLIYFGAEESYEDALEYFTINDLYVTEKTSRYNEGNVIFIATNNGVTVIEEKPGDEENSNFKYYLIKT